MSKMFQISKTKKKKGKYCCAYACKNEPIKRKGGLCHKHYARKRRILAPIETRYYKMKHKAQTRGIQFELTLAELTDSCNRTGYLIQKGLRGRNATVDRIRNWEGYHKDNI